MSEPKAQAWVLNSRDLDSVFQTDLEPQTARHPQLQPWINHSKRQVRKKKTVALASALALHHAPKPDTMFVGGRTPDALFAHAWNPSLGCMLQM